MAVHGLRERHVEVVDRAVSLVIVDQGTQHRAIALGVQDSFEDHVVAGVEAVPADGRDQADVHPAGHVVLVQDLPADHVLLDKRYTAAEPGPHPQCGGGLARAGGSSQHDEPCPR